MILQLCAEEGKTQIWAIVLSLAIIVFCIVFLTILGVTYTQMNARIRKGEYMGALKAATSYRKNLGGLKRDKTTLKMALLYFQMGDRENMRSTLFEIKDWRLEKAQWFWLVMEAFAYDDPALDELVSRFDVARKYQARGLKSYEFYNTLYSLVKEYRICKDEQALPQIKTILASEDVLTKNLILKALKIETI